METQRPQMPQFFCEALERMKVDPSTLLTILVRGSRVRESHSESSDWDVCAVTTSQFRQEEHLQDKITNIDLELVDRKSFEEKMEANDIWLLDRLFAPPPFVWKEEVDFKKIFKLDKNALHAGLLYQADLQYGKAPKKFACGDLYGCKKKIFHAILITVYAIEVARTGALIDYKAANHYWWDLRDASGGWRELHAKYHPIYMRLLSEFCDTVGLPLLELKDIATIQLPPVSTVKAEIEEESDEKGKIIAEDDVSAEGNTVALTTVALLKRHGLANVLKTYPKLSFSLHREYVNLICLKSDLNGNDEGDAALVLQECKYGLVLDSKNDWAVVCFTPAITLDGLLKGEWDHYLVCRLYNHEGLWKLASTNKPDSSGEVVVTREGATQRISFSVFFWTVWIEQGYDMPSDISLSYTFILFGSDVKHHTIALHAAHNAHTHQFEDAGQLALKNKWVHDKDVVAVGKADSKPLSRIVLL